MEALLALAGFLAFALLLVHAQASYSSNALKAVSSFQSSVYDEACAASLGFLYYNGGGAVPERSCPGVPGPDFNSWTLAKWTNGNGVVNVETFEPYK